MAFTIIQGDAAAQLQQRPPQSVHCCVTSPPYWGLRDYGVAGQLGLEATPEAYVDNLVGVFREVRRVLHDDGTLWLNLGDSYWPNGSSQRASGGGGFKDNDRVRVYSQPKMAKQLVGIPWRVAFALQADGWYLRSDIIWSKPNPMPESVTDRPTRAHEYIFMLSKKAQYYYDAEAIAEPVNNMGKVRPFRNGDEGTKRKDNGRLYQPKETRNKRSVWEVATQPYSAAHFATFPPKLIEPCILAGCPKGGTVLDPFAGAGTTLLVADRLGREGLGIELNPAYIQLARDRLIDDCPLFAKEVP